MPSIIVVSRHLRTPWTLSLESTRNRWIMAGTCSALLLAAALGGAVLSRWTSGGDSALEPLHTELLASRKALEDARAQAQREINAMAIKLGELQAQANRLNALGQRLTERGRFEGGEFNFSERPSMGGPENPDGEPIDLAASLGKVEASFAQAGKQLDVLDALLKSEAQTEASRPNRAPAPGFISSGFGPRPDPFTGARSHHFGLDFDANIGDPIWAAADGIVSFSGRRGGFGNTVVVDHGDGYQTLYAHNQKNLVRVGDLVRAGQQLATVGSSGRSTGSHLHFEVHVNGRPVNPKAYLERLRR